MISSGMSLPRVSLPVVAVVCLLGAAGGFLWSQYFGFRPLPSPTRPSSNGPTLPPFLPASRSREVARALSHVLPQPPKKAAASQPATDDDEADEPDPPLADWMLAFFAPYPGENLLHYRDRIYPVVKAVIDPQRARVADLRKSFEDNAHLDDKQKKALDDAVAESGEAMKDRIMQGLMSGELDPSRLKPAGVVSFTRDILEDADQANRKLRASLRPDQLSALDGSAFDVDDYLLFSTRWEDLLGITE